MSNLPKNLTKNESSGCIMARIMRNKEQYSRNFSLVEYGSWKKAEKAASEWLAKIKKTLPPPTTSHGVKTSRNSSGVVGVSLKAAPLASGAMNYAWHAFWPGNPNGTRWAVEKFGDDNAFCLAVISRQRESADRKAVEREFKRIQGKPVYKAILKQKMIAVV